MITRLGPQLEHLGAWLDARLAGASDSDASDITQVNVADFKFIYSLPPLESYLGAGRSHEFLFQIFQPRIAATSVSVLGEASLSRRTRLASRPASSSEFVGHQPKLGPVGRGNFGHVI